MTRMGFLLTRLWWRKAWWLVGASAVATFGIAWLVGTENLRLAIAAVLVATLGGVALMNPRYAIVATLVYLTVLGDFRRALIPLTGWPSEDPLLLVGPTIAVLLIGFVVAGQRLHLDTPLSYWLLVLMILMLFQVFNPLQGGIFVGMAGALFYIVPLLWFWVGRSYATPNFMAFLLYRVVIPLAVLAALLGLYQAFYGLLPFEQEWVNLAGYSALSVEGHIRPISFFVSASEFAQYLGIALVVLWVDLLGRARIALVLIPLLALALFLESSRLVIVALLFTVVLLWALQTRSLVAWLPRFALGLIFIVAGLALGLSLLLQLSLTGRVGALVHHQVSGLLNPFDPAESTLRLHIDFFVQGLTEGVAKPFGQGLGATSIAGAKYGSTEITADALGTLGTATGGTGSTEVDLSNMFVSLGIAGGVIYMVVIALVLLTALRYWHKSRNLVALAILGVLVVELGQWLNGGHYALSALIWFCIGSLDKLQKLREDYD